MLHTSDSYDHRSVSDARSKPWMPGKNDPAGQQNGGRGVCAVAAHDHGGPLVASYNDPGLSLATDDMRTRMTLALEDELHDDPAMAALFEPKRSLTGGATLKPCIVPGNALQLIDDDPTASRSHTPSSVIVLESDPQLDPAAPHDASADSSADLEAPQRRPVPRVRFRSRVRITSGLRRSKHIEGDAASPASSASDSPSSSISAPLRWQADENTAWGPLGRRLSAYAQQNGWQKRAPSAGPRHGDVRAPVPHRQPQPRAKMDERTPLVRTGRHVAYVDAGLDGGRDADDERLPEGEYEDSDDESERDHTLRKAALRREEEAIFGPWPWRLFNRHWWWWHTEPVLRCLCADDPEYE
ncbi:uncharacterized protein PHACADRAFT_246386 [Phanerochaete carnosa HHB-10118-sp]|uniref:Uncharacterized protein n=1 Tax=Phanerochaete carnosa (strain HHB-10118-sp) TaxID=650164 RepID=K5W933_PHACS|nr:uncharacterized protein PHACADRAFT_246386 [Phanerochaete carnosa HHB-10118-sp]EKM60443.1 hypothetical protein PHACADRAFT_246386 [Phanerochaete carnosa HHB-10118-sp]